MNRLYLIPACLLNLGLLAAISAQEVKVNLPAEQGAATASTPAVSVATSAPAAPAPTFTEAQLLEEFGWFVGKRLGLAELGFTTEQANVVVRGFLTAASGKEAPYDLDKAGPQMDAMMQKKQEVFLTKVRGQNLGEAKVFFEKLKENKNVVSLESGLRYEIVQPGQGAYPKPTDTVKVHYTGRLLNGTIFDSSVDRGQPADIQLNNVIPGWTEGLQKINEGGKIRLYIPPSLAYGDSGQGAIPPSSTLIFDVELLSIQAAAAAPAKK
jgi:FKBP-type peptidyl-prolyl cis-trans isomerase